MKSPFYILTIGSLALCAAGNGRASEQDSRLFMPDDIKPVKLEATERNPFEKRLELKTNEELIKGVELSEEDRVRHKFHNLKVTGGTQGVRVMLSDLILKEGALVAPVLPDQTIQLMVTDISANEIELTWVSDLGKKRPRSIIIPYDLSPTVGFLLSGQSDVENGAERIMTEKVMQRGSRPELPKLKTVGKDGQTREIDPGAVVGQ